MKNAEINIRDPFILCREGRYYLYGTRAKDFGMQTGGFDVYTGTDLTDWSAPRQVFDSAKWGFNTASNWAPEVHAYAGRFYMFATFAQKKRQPRDVCPGLRFAGRGIPTCFGQAAHPGGLVESGRHALCGSRRRALARVLS